MNPITKIFSTLWQSTLPNPKPREYYESILPKMDYKQGVPKHVYQTFPTRNLPKEARQNVEKMKSINPEWTFHLFDDNDIKTFIAEKYGENILKYYKRIDNSYGAAKADFFRYLLIYAMGGLYIDYKSSITKPLDNFILPTDGFILSHWDNRPGEPHEGFGNFQGLKVNVNNPKGEYMQWVIIASPGHPFLREIIINMLQLIDQYNPYIQSIGFEGTFRLTGPILYTETLESIIPRYNKNQDYRIVDLFSDWGFKYSIFESQPTKEQPNCITFQHVNHLKTNYRDNVSPLIVHPNKITQAITKSFLKVKTTIASFRRK